MLLNILRSMRGYVRFEASGKYPERFLNITARHGVRLWDVERVGGGFSGCMYRADYRNIRPLARGAGVVLRVKDKRGLPSFAFRWRGRPGIVFGGCAFVLTVFVMSMFIWSVDVVGLETLSISEMRGILREKGLYVGAFKPALDARRIADEVMIDDPDIGWMAVNIEGSYASVEVKEKAQPPEVNDIETPCNVKAARDGVIISVEGYEGKIMTAEGSGVIEGQLLVSGVVEDADGSARLVHAAAKVNARTTHEAVFSVPDEYTGFVETEEAAERRYIDLAGLRIPYVFSSVGSPDSLSREMTEAPAPLGVTLPVGTVRERVTALDESRITLDDNFAKELLIQQSELYEAFCLSSCTVESRDYSLTHKDGMYTLSVVYTCIEDIAYTDPIGTDENTDFTKYVTPTEDAEPSP